MRLWTICIILLCVSHAIAVTPATWTHNAESDFADGKFESTVLSSLGEIRLGGEIEILLPSDVAPSVVSAVVRIGDVIYAAGGDEAVVYKIAQGKTEKFAEFGGAMVSALIAVDDKLLAGVGGDKSGLYWIDAQGKVEKFWSDPNVKYVWAVVPGRKHRLYAATGPGGKVFAIDTSKDQIQSEVIYDAGKLARNILSLVRSQEGLIYAGTDKTGLVVEINPRTKKSRVILDAKEKEISALAVDESGAVYAATSDAGKANAKGKAPPKSTNSGRAIKHPTTKPSSTTNQKEPSKDQSPGPDKTDLVPDKTKVNDGITESPIDSANPHRPQSDPKHQTKEQLKQGDPVAELTGQTFANISVATGIEALIKDTEQAESPKIPEEFAKLMAKAIESGEKEPPSRPARPGRGNAVYMIRPDGLIETRFRRPVTILSMLLRAGKLYLGTGNGGVIYSLSADGDEIVRLADTDAKQVTALEFGSAGEILFGTANKGSVGKIGSKLTPSGTFTSEVLDCKQIAQWGTMRIRAHTPTGTKVTIATRSGNVEDPDQSTWSSWSKAQASDSGFLSIGSVPGRFLQYRLTLSSTVDVSPVVREVELIYQVGNLPPTVTSVTVKPSAKGKTGGRSGAGGAKAFRHVTVKATDPNGDRLSFTIEFRHIGSQNWIQIAKDLKVSKYVWDTRTVGDGLYELRVRASDSRSNPPDSALTSGRISEPVVVDNTSPIVNIVGVKTVEERIVVSGSVLDASSRVVSLGYSVDSQEKWTVLGVTDGISDADREDFRFELTELEPGPHRIAVKVEDLYGNVGYGYVNVTAGQ